VICFTRDAQKKVDPPEPYSKICISEWDIFLRKSIAENVIQGILSEIEFLSGARYLRHSGKYFTKENMLGTLECLKSVFIDFFK
jgi:hypothetical protein